MNQRDIFLAWQEVHNSRKTYRQRIQVGGNVISVRTYEKDQAYAFRHNHRKPSPADSESAITPEQQAVNQQKAGRRAKHAVVSLVNSNFGEHPKGFLPGQRSLKLLTLTYKENMQDREQAAGDLERFVKRLEYHLQEKIEYVNVFERQQRGAWHLHLMLVSAFIPVRTLTALWNVERGQGTLKIERIRLIGNAGKYLAKYLTEDFTGETDHVFGKKRFTTSRGLTDRSDVFRERVPLVRHEEVKAVFSACIERGQDGKPMVREGDYDGEYTGKVLFLELVLIPIERTWQVLWEFLNLLEMRRRTSS